MKRLILSVTIGALMLGSAMADRPKVEQRSQKDNTDYEYIYITGSNIPQRIKKRNIIAVGTTAPTYIIDQREMERSGNSDLRTILNRYPGIQISH
jgi:outer membrane cobalamin receptor